MDIVERIQNGTVRIGLIGLGYVGLPLAVEFGKVFDTVGFDVKPERLEMLRRGIDTTLETSEEELRAAKHLRYTGEMQELQECDFFIVTVPTPVDKYNRPDLTPLYRASETVGRVMRPGSIVIYESTVYPGCTEEECVPILEKYSNLAFNRDFFCGYSPERINPGDKEHTLTKILKITSGSTPEAADAVDALYRAILKNGTFRASSLKVAEAAKVIENSQRDLNIAFVNELAKIFHLIGIDTGEVLEAAGTKWNFLKFRPGLVGGHCIGVDPYYLTHKAQALGYLPEVILAGRRINDGMGHYIAVEVVKLCSAPGCCCSASPSRRIARTSATPARWTLRRGCGNSAAKSMCTIRGPMWRRSGANTGLRRRTLRNNWPVGHTTRWCWRWRTGSSGNWTSLPCASRRRWFTISRGFCPANVLTGGCNR